LLYLESAAMSKPAQLSDFDEARRIVGMLESATNPEEYKELFGISDEDEEFYRNLLDNRAKPTKLSFIES